MSPSDKKNAIQSIFDGGIENNIITQNNNFYPILLMPFHVKKTFLMRYYQGSICACDQWGG